MATTCHYASNIIIGTGTGPVGWGNFDLNAYETGTQAALDEIVKGSMTGYGLIMLIRELSGEIVITPNFSKVCNATAALPTWKSKNQVEIIYTPSVFGKVNCNGAGFTADEFLLHELVHAYRFLKNKKSNTFGLTIGDFQYTNFEEFASILYVNIYMSAKGKSTLRKHHLDGTAMPANMANNRGFFQNQKEHARRVHDLICEDYHYCQTYVRKDYGVFNPIDYFLKNSVEVTNMIDWPKPMVPSP
ncbi:hypothetical protein [Dyadobacter luticola]|uniref:Uncharacterized protein n=1 Tax=Dyadobacter luticola TaxID=1979387 RepID=A0A5R9KP00_9BACT|nr:hypothetical protein [Dyadobacter luticola]TLU98012.1 hypothetical protein FEN17_24805 [Dyadobacter luticola]